MVKAPAPDSAEQRRWAEALRAIAAPVVARDEKSRQFVDEMGHRRPVDGAFLEWCGRHGGPGAGTERGGARTDLDVVLWECVCRAREDRDGACARAWSLVLEGEGALTSRDDFRGIEVWTETELSALHALSWLALVSDSRAAWDRMMRAARWHVEHTQPDNATAHPWALHVFLWLEREEAGIGARAYAETLLHNCQVGLGRADLFSAYVLLDCARGIEAEDARARPR